jgi:putative tryptophan/tyrosine transport system substrate-binding protein
VRRREFITLLGGAAAWPLAARAQQPERMRRIGVLMNTGADEPESQARLAALQGLQELGWAAGRNLRIDYRWSPGDLARLRKDAKQLVALRSEQVRVGGQSEDREGARSRDADDGARARRRGDRIKMLFCCGA